MCCAAYFRSKYRCPVLAVSPKRKYTTNKIKFTKSNHTLISPWLFILICYRAHRKSKKY